MKLNHSIRAGAENSITYQVHHLTTSLREDGKRLGDEDESQYYLISSSGKLRRRVAVYKKRFLDNNDVASPHIRCSVFYNLRFIWESELSMKQNKTCLLRIHFLF